MAAAVKTKRKLSATESDSGAKRPRPDEHFALELLPPCLLEEIFTYLSPCQLMQMVEVVPSFEDIIPAKRLWRRVDARGSVTSVARLSEYSKFFNETTALIMLEAEWRGQVIIDERFWVHVNSLRNLTVLSLEKMKLEQSTSIESFPPQLTELSLRFTKVPPLMLRFISSHMLCLKTLLLDNCYWVNAHTLLSVSKLEGLENLSIRDCKYVYDMVCYTSLFKYGFRSLRRLDARNTYLGEKFLLMFCSIWTLRELYLEQPSQPVPKVDLGTLSGVPQLQVGHNISICAIHDIDHFIKERKGRARQQRSKRVEADDAAAWSSSDDEDVFAAMDNSGMSELTDSTIQRCFRDLAVIEETDPEQRRPHCSYLFRSPCADECTCEFRAQLDAANAAAAAAATGPAEGLCLQVLVLRGYTQLTNHCLKYLNHLGLTVLDVTGTSITTTGIQQFQRRNPTCRIYHETACTCPLASSSSSKN